MMLQAASLKLGLDYAVMHNMEAHRQRDSSSSSSSSKPGAESAEPQDGVEEEGAVGIGSSRGSRQQQQLLQ